MEPRMLMAADAIQIGSVYIEEDTGTDLQPDFFYIRFEGGAENTQLNRLVFDGDKMGDGFSIGDVFFDTAAGELGADDFHAFNIEQLETANPNASVTATVEDGSTQLTLEFTNFFAGDLLVFSIDVDEVLRFDPAETDLDEINDGFDPITSGAEFHGTHFHAEFSAPHFEDASGENIFRNRYDEWLRGTDLDLPEDNVDGKRNRTAGAGIDIQQVPKPISLSGVVYRDANEDLQLQSSEQRLSNVQLDLYKWENGSFIATGHSTTTDSQGRYEFGTDLGLQPGTYQVRQTQPVGYYSVGATPGRLNGQLVGATVSGNPDILTEIEILKGDQHAKQLNFAENLPSTIGGHVCLVVHGFDCFSEDSEKAPLEGVLIELRDADGTLIETTRTGADGRYEFADLRAGTYSLTEITPEGLLEGSARTGSEGGRVQNASLITQIVIGGGVTAIDYNFCEISPSDLSGHTFFDANNNGQRESGESPLADVLVQLWDESGELVAETRTDANGHYIFHNLRPGEYRITEQTPDGYLPGQAAVGTIAGSHVGSTDATGDVIDKVLLPGGSSGINYDFGEILPGSIAGQVIADTNGNCFIDAEGDHPLEGVRLELLGENGSIIATTLTDANGEYRFDALLPGEYSVRQVQPDGYFQGTQAAGSGGGDDSIDNLIRFINVAPDANLVEYDFCEIPPGSISGSVFVDMDEDCIFDSDEEPIEGVTMRLYDSQGASIATTRTNADGRYTFNGLRPGDYTVRQTQPSGYLQGGQRAGSGGGDASVQDAISAILVEAGSDLIDYDFCELLPASLSGYVYVDADQNGSFEPHEETLAGVTITLLDSQGNVLRTTTTSSDGHYEFDGLRPGDYTLRETQPEGYFHGGQQAGTGGGDASQRDIISDIQIAAGLELVHYNFGELLPGSISGAVFADLDHDCIHDPNEDLIEGVTIELLNESGSIVATSFTDANGEYSFGNLRPGVYSVRETQPDGYFQGGQLAPLNPEGNRVGDTNSTDLISSIIVGSGRQLVEANFCEHPPSEITGYVFQDGPVINTVTGEVPEELRAVRDGQRTSDDTPISGVRITLRLIGGEHAPSSMALPGTYQDEFIEAWTDEHGFFRFTGLPGGTYHLFQAQPEGYEDGLDIPGTSGGISFHTEAEVEAFRNSADAKYQDLQKFATSQLTDAILLIELSAGQISQENNFSEVRAQPVLPTPPLPDQPAPPPETPLEPPPQYPTADRIAWRPIEWAPLPLLVGFGSLSPSTWHLSVINGGYPRGIRGGDPLTEEAVAENTERLDLQQWTIVNMRESSWEVASSDSLKLISATERSVFDIPDATPLTGDFNGDGFDELALFIDGEWFIDVNGNGKWDSEDIWLKLGSKGDQPVAGDWDGDGKDDVGVFGRRWRGDERALAHEAGLPDSENTRRAKRKTLPPREDQAPDVPRLMKKSHQGEPRADLIDHVFRFGSDRDVAVSGDFNGDGIATLGIFHDGKWTLDVDGDGRLNDHDMEMEFGQPGDIPLVGDFDGDGIDDLAILRDNRVIVDSNRNGHIDATDQVFELETEDGHVIVGDFDGDGSDEPAVHRSKPVSRVLEARLR